VQPIRDVLACVVVSVLHMHVGHAAHDDLMDLGQVCAGGAAARGPRRGISGGRVQPIRDVLTCVRGQRPSHACGPCSAR